MNAIESSNHTHYRAKCPKCGHPNIREIPIKQTRKTLEFECAYAAPNEKPCGVKFTVYVSETETFTPEEHKFKPYMNRAERSAFLMLYNIADNFSNILIDMPTMPYQSKYAFQQAQEWIGYGAYEWVKEKDRKTVEQLYREGKMYAINLVHRREAKEIAKKSAAIETAMRNEIIQEDRDVVLDLALATFQFCCKQCDGTPAKSEEGCPVQNALDKLAVPPWEAVEECHYAYSGLTDDEIAKIKEGRT